MTTNYDRLPMPLQRKLPHEDICGPDNWAGTQKHAQPEDEQYYVDGICPADIHSLRHGARKAKHD